MPQGGFRGTFKSFEELKKVVLKADKSGERTEDRLAGIIFARSDQPLGEKIVKSFDYFDGRTGESFNFFLAGWRKSNAWLFDEKRFIQAKDVIEAEADWVYDGGCYFLVFATRGRTKQDIVVDLSNVLAIRLDRLEELKSGDGLDALIERICNFVQNYKGHDPLTGFRNQEWRVAVIEGIKGVVLGLLPEGARKKAQYAAEMFIRDVSMKNRRAETVATMRRVIRVNEDPYA